MIEEEVVDKSSGSTDGTVTDVVAAAPSIHVWRSESASESGRRRAARGIIAIVVVVPAADEGS